jgi:MFS family permease
MYDFYIYGVLAAVFATHFFPAGNAFLATLATWAVFWFGFILRPFGAILFGHLGDLIGRKFTFMLTLGMMGERRFWSAACRAMRLGALPRRLSSS